MNGAPVTHHIQFEVVSFVAGVGVQRGMVMGELFPGAVEVVRHQMD